MATQIFIKQNGNYCAGYIDVMNGWINRTDHLEPIGIINILKHWFFPKKEFHAIISKGNRIHGIIAKW